jgi:hypothetical protein
MYSVKRVCTSASMYLRFPVSPPRRPASRHYPRTRTPPTIYTRVSSNPRIYPLLPPTPRPPYSSYQRTLMRPLYTITA